MAINKFVDRQGNTLLDLSVDSVTSDNYVLAGKTYHGPDGLQHTGTLDPGPLDYSQYNFIDYDGTLLYSYTDEELDALTALPAPKDHTDENLEFQEWNWTLADLKAWDRTRFDRPLVGANYVTIDRKSYLYMDTPYSGATLSFKTSGTLNSVDWGDGTTDTTTSHVYATPGQYVIIIDMAEGGYWYFESWAISTSTNKQWIKKIKLGNINKIGGNGSCYSIQSISIPNSVTSIDSAAFASWTSLTNITIPNGVTSIPYNVFSGCYNLQNISIPNSVTSIENNVFNKCYSLKKISIPNSVTSIGIDVFSNCYSLQSILIPDGITSIGSTSFYNCYSIQSISIPNSVTSIDTNAFFKCDCLTLDLTKQTKVITLASNIGLNSNYNKILVPNSLLSNYKSASYWSDYAASMVGV